MIRHCYDTKIREHRVTQQHLSIVITAGFYDYGDILSYAFGEEWKTITATPDETKASLVSL